MLIREYDTNGDHEQLRACIVELQDAERVLEPQLPAGEEMTDAHIRFLTARCAEEAGKIFVADIDGSVAGFVCILTRVSPKQPDQERGDYAYVTDLVVLPEYRRRAIGRALLEHAEAFARTRGATTVRITVLSKNEAAHALYASLSFDDYAVQLVKRL